jgi:hypothetical protein
MALLCAFSLTAVSSTSPAPATVSVYQTIEETARRADLVVRGTIDEISVHKTRDGRHIYTRHVMRVEELFAGAIGLEHGMRVVFTQLGGEIDGLALDYLGRPTFEEGEEVVLFLLRRDSGQFIVYGLKGGVLRVTQDEAGPLYERDWGGMGLIDSPPGLVSGRERFTPAQFRRLVGSRPADSGSDGEGRP